MFLGFIDEATPATLYFDTADLTGLPLGADAPPTFRTFGQSGPIAAAVGAATAAQAGAVTNATNATPVVVTAAAHGLATGSVVLLTGVGGNGGANGSFTVTVVDANTFSLNGSAGAGAYTAGGSWTLVGLWKLLLAGSAIAALEAGKTYTLVVSWAYLGALRVRRYTLSVQ
jgi:hypothetical protein